MPDWVKDDKKWDKAVAAFKKDKKKDPKTSSDYAVVTTIYKKMGGKISAEMEELAEAIATQYKDQFTEGRPKPVAIYRTTIDNDHSHGWFQGIGETSKDNGHVHVVDHRANKATRESPDSTILDHDHDLVQPGLLTNTSTGEHEPKVQGQAREFFEALNEKRNDFTGPGKLAYDDLEAAIKKDKSILKNSKKIARLLSDVRKVHKLDLDEINDILEDLVKKVK